MAEASDEMTERMMGCLLALSLVDEKDYKTAMMKECLSAASSV